MAKADDSMVASVFVFQIDGFGTKSHHLIADSISQEAVVWAAGHGPFDCVFIDGDHDGAGPALDWHNYRQMASKIVAFHDIRNNEHTVKDLWRQIRNASAYMCSEVADAGSTLGIGVVHLA